MKPLSQKHNRQKQQQPLSPQIKKNNKLQKHVLLLNAYKQKQLIKNQNQQYAKLTLKSLIHNYPVSELKPYAAFFQISQIQQNMQNDHISFKKNNSKKRHTLYEKIVFGQKLPIDTRNTTFYQKKTKLSKKNKYISKTLTSFQSKTVDDQLNMVTDYFKENNHLITIQSKVFQRVNQRIKDQYPLHFEPNQNHQESKCRSKSCSQGFFKRKKYRVEQKYDFQQPGFYRFPLKKQKKSKYSNSTNSFCLYSRSKNRIISTQKILPSKIESQQIFQKLNSLEMNTSTRAKFRQQTNALYKKYMRNSFNDKKQTLIQQMKIKIQ